MGAGMAVPMARNFGCSTYPLEDLSTRGDINKLGQIEWKKYPVSIENSVYVVNAYTQYNPNPLLKPLDYEALTLCMRKMNSIFRGMRIGLPMIGAGLAGGDWERIKTIIQTELKDCDTTIVIFNK
jgi:O-acetyl-ADP-ribose deacetylase (regulator of RNase III)